MADGMNAATLKTDIINALKTLNPDLVNNANALSNLEQTWAVITEKIITHIQQNMKVEIALDTNTVNGSVNGSVTGTCVTPSGPGTISGTASTNIGGKTGVSTTIS